MAKNIVIFADGTNNEGGVGDNTNVYKLFNMVIDRDPTRQISFYDSGIGTDRKGWFGSITGAGIEHNIEDCYNFLHKHYHVGDKIYLLGFSRGATTVRSLSGFINLFGILPMSSNKLFKKAWRIYEINDAKKRKQKAQQFIKKNHTMWVKIEFLGVWDTVAALGIPNKALNKIIDVIPFWKHRYHDLRLSEAVVHGRHALAIDERRKTFLPTLWDNVVKDYQTMKQVWFCGMHADVGGGYAEQELSDIALRWMIEEAEKIGLHIYPNHCVDINPNSQGMMHDSCKSVFRFGQKKRRSWNESTHGKLIVHKSVNVRLLVDLY